MIRPYSEPVLIGPPFSGKSTAGAALAVLLGVPLVDLDAVAEPYYEQASRPIASFKDRIGRDGYSAAHRWWQPARLLAATRVLQDHHDCVFAFGAGHSHYEDDVHAKLLEARLRDYRNVFLLLPSRDPVVGVQALRERCRDQLGHDWRPEGIDFLRLWYESAQNRTLCTHIIFTEGESPQDTALRLRSLMG